MRFQTSMPDDPRQKAVGMIARVICAATGRDRVAIPALLAAFRTIPALRGITGQDIGRLLAGTGWRPSQWRENGGRVRGFIAPVTVQEPDRAEPTIARVYFSDKRHI